MIWYDMIDKWIDWQTYRYSMFTDWSCYPLFIHFFVLQLSPAEEKIQPTRPYSAPLGVSRRSLSWVGGSPKFRRISFHQMVIFNWLVVSNFPYLKRSYFCGLVDYSSTGWWNHHPNWRTHIFRRLRSTTKQSMVSTMGRPWERWCLRWYPFPWQPLQAWHKPGGSQEKSKAGGDLGPGGADAQVSASWMGFSDLLQLICYLVVRRERFLASGIHIHAIFPTMGSWLELLGVSQPSNSL